MEKYLGLLLLLGVIYYFWRRSGFAGMRNPFAGWTLPPPGTNPFPIIWSYRWWWGPVVVLVALVVLWYMGIFGLLALAAAWIASNLAGTSLPAHAGLTEAKDALLAFVAEWAWVMVLAALALAIILLFRKHRYVLAGAATFLLVAWLYPSYKDWASRPSSPSYTAPVQTARVAPPAHDPHKHCTNEWRPITLGSSFKDLGNDGGDCTVDIRYEGRTCIFIRVFTGGERGSFCPGETTKVIPRNMTAIRTEGAVIQAHYRLRRPS